MALCRLTPRTPHGCLADICFAWQLKGVMTAADKCLNQRCGATVPLGYVYCPSCRHGCWPRGSFLVFLLSAWGAAASVLCLFVGLALSPRPLWILIFLYYILILSTAFGWNGSLLIRFVGCIYLLLTVSLFGYGVVLSPLLALLILLALVMISTLFTDVEFRFSRLAIVSFGFLLAERYWLRQATIAHGTRALRGMTDAVAILTQITALRVGILLIIGFLAEGTSSNWRRVLFMRLFAVPEPHAYILPAFRLPRRQNRFGPLAPVLQMPSLVVSAAVYFGKCLVNAGRYCAWLTFRCAMFLGEIIARIGWYLMRLLTVAALAALRNIWQGITGVVSVAVAVVFSFGIPFMTSACIAIFASRTAHAITRGIAVDMAGPIYGNMAVLVGLYVGWVQLGPWLLSPGGRVAWFGRGAGPTLFADAEAISHFARMKQPAWNLMENFVVQRLTIPSLMLLALVELSLPALRRRGWLWPSATQFTLGVTGISVLLLLGVGLVIEVFRIVRGGEPEAA